MKPWIIYDPFVFGGENFNPRDPNCQVVHDFDTKDEAEAALAAHTEKEPDGYAGCLVIPYSEL